MRGLSNRLSALERGAEPELLPAVRAWLGWTLTESEQAALAAERETHQDISKLSKETRQWLGIN